MEILFDFEQSNDDVHIETELNLMFTDSFVDSIYMQLDSFISADSSLYKTNIFFDQYISNGQFFNKNKSLLKGDNYKVNFNEQLYNYTETIAYSNFLRSDIKIKLNKKKFNFINTDFAVKQSKKNKLLYVLKTYNLKNKIDNTVLFEKSPKLIKPTKKYKLIDEMIKTKINNNKCKIFSFDTKFNKSYSNNEITYYKKQKQILLNINDIKENSFFSINSENNNNNNNNNNLKVFKKHAVKINENSKSVINNFFRIERKKNKKLIEIKEKALKYSFDFNIKLENPLLVLNQKNLKIKIHTDLKLKKKEERKTTSILKIIISNKEGNNNIKLLNSKSINKKMKNNIIECEEYNIDKKMFNIINTLKNKQIKKNITDEICMFKIIATESNDIKFVDINKINMIEKQFDKILSVINIINSKYNDKNNFKINNTKIITKDNFKLLNENKIFICNKMISNDFNETELVNFKKSNKQKINLISNYTINKTSPNDLLSFENSLNFKQDDQYNLNLIKNNIITKQTKKKIIINKLKNIFINSKEISFIDIIETNKKVDFDLKRISIHGSNKINSNTVSIESIIDFNHITKRQIISDESLSFDFNTIGKNLLTTNMKYTLKHNGISSIFIKTFILNKIKSNKLSTLKQETIKMYNDNFTNSIDIKGFINEDANKTNINYLYGFTKTKENSINKFIDFNVTKTKENSINKFIDFNVTKTQKQITNKNDNFSFTEKNKIIKLLKTNYSLQKNNRCDLNKIKLIKLENSQKNILSKLDFFEITKNKKNYSSLLYINEVENTKNKLLSISNIYESNKFNNNIFNITNYIKMSKTSNNNINIIKTFNLKFKRNQFTNLLYLTKFDRNSTNNLSLDNAIVANKIVDSSITIVKTNFLKNKFNNFSEIIKGAVLKETNNKDIGLTQSKRINKFFDNDINIIKSIPTHHILNNTINIINDIIFTKYNNELINNKSVYGSNKKNQNESYVFDNIQVQHDDGNKIYINKLLNLKSHSDNSLYKMKNYILRNGSNNSINIFTDEKAINKDNNDLYENGIFNTTNITYNDISLINTIDINNDNRKKINLIKVLNLTNTKQHQINLFDDTEILSSNNTDFIIENLVEIKTFKQNSIEVLDYILLESEYKSFDILGDTSIKKALNKDLGVEEGLVLDKGKFLLKINSDFDSVIKDALLLSTIKDSKRINSHLKTIFSENNNISLKKSLDSKKVFLQNSNVHINKNSDTVNLFDKIKSGYNEIREVQKVGDIYSFKKQMLYSARIKKLKTFKSIEMQNFIISQALKKITKKNHDIRVDNKSIIFIRVPTNLNVFDILQFKHKVKKDLKIENDVYGFKKDNKDLNKLNELLKIYNSGMDVLELKTNFSFKISNINRSFILAEHFGFKNVERNLERFNEIYNFCNGGKNLKTDYFDLTFKQDDKPLYETKNILTFKEIKRKTEIETEMMPFTIEELKVSFPILNDIAFDKKYIEVVELIDVYCQVETPYNNFFNDIVGDGWDELILPKNDFNYDSFTDTLIDEEGNSINPLKTIDNNTFISKVPNQHPLTGEYEDIATEFLLIDVSIMKYIIETIYIIWKQNIFAFGNTSMRNSIVDMMKRIDMVIQLKIPPSLKEQAYRVLRLVRWFSEEAILNNSEYEITKHFVESKSELQTGEIQLPHTKENLKVTEVYSIVPIDSWITSTLEITLDFKNNSTFTFNSSINNGIIYIYLNGVLINQTSSGGLIEVDVEKGINIIKIECVPNENNMMNLVIGNIIAPNTKYSHITTEFVPDTSKGNKVIDEMLKKASIYTDVLDNNVDFIEDLKKGNLALGALIDKLINYFDIHHLGKKSKGKRMTMKK